MIPAKGTSQSEKSNIGEKIPKNILVTGAAGFIGFHLCRLLLEKGEMVTGIDNLNDYYDPALKQSRLDIINQYQDFTFYKADIANKKEVDEIFAGVKPQYVINLAAQAGVRYSITNPYAYIESNITGFINILEACRMFPVKHLLYASSSSVYGANKSIPFSTDDKVDHPVSLYAATKKSNELMAHTYSHLYNIPSTGLRFFTVYGPWGRPDMAYFSFTKDILSGKPIKVFNRGNMKRDFTYIDDIINGIYGLLDNRPVQNPSWNEKTDDNGTSFAPYRIYNIGNNRPVSLLEFIEILEEKLDKKAEKIFMDMQPGDVETTYADISALQHDIGFNPSRSIDQGLDSFVEWYKEYYHV